METGYNILIDYGSEGHKFVRDDKGKIRYFLNIGHAVEYLSRHSPSFAFKIVQIVDLTNLVLKP